MTVEELRDKREDLENKINNLLVTFEAETGIIITSTYIIREKAREPLSAASICNFPRVNIIIQI